MYAYPSKIFAVVVVYNKSVSNSNSIRSLLDSNLSALQIIVVDNSTMQFNNEVECLNNCISYISMNGNSGLSKAYNVAIDYIQQYSNKNDLIIWFDDDTHLTKEYFIALNDALLKNEISDIFVPIIYGQNDVIYSPNNAGFLKNKLLKSAEDIINLKKFNAINSCLAARFHVYENYRYNENLFLDSVDHNFFDEMRVMKRNFAVLPIKIRQNFFQRELCLDIPTVKKRFQIRVIDLMTYSRKGVKYNFLALLKAFAWGLLFSWKCKSFSIFFICIRYAFLGFLRNMKYFILIKKQRGIRTV